MERNQQQVRWWLAPRSLARALALKVSLALGGCGVGGFAAIVAGIILFCTPFGAPLIVAGLADIYVEFKGDDPDDPCRDCRPPLIPCDPPNTPIPQRVLKVCWLHHADSGCPLWRGSAVRANSSDRPTWSFDSHVSTQNPQHVTADPFRMSYPAGRDWPVNGRIMSGTSLICSFIFHDLDGDGRGDEWATAPGYYDFKGYYANGDTADSSLPSAQGGLGHSVYIGEGTTTLTHGWLPSGAKFYGFDFTPMALVMKAELPDEEFLTEEGDIVDLPSEEHAATLVGASGGHWEQIAPTTFRFVATQ